MLTLEKIEQFKLIQKEIDYLVKKYYDKHIKAEDIPDIISSILEKVAKRKVKVEGNGITEDIEMKL